jgi:hypothetical protein
MTNPAVIFLGVLQSSEFVYYIKAVPDHFHQSLYFTTYTLWMQSLNTIIETDDNDKENRLKTQVR